MDPVTQKLISASSLDNTDRDTQVVFVGTAITTIAGGTRLAAYQWTNSGGFGTKYSDPVTASASTPLGLQPTTQNDAMLVLNTTSPFLRAYDFDFDTGWGSVTEIPITVSGTSPDSLLRHPTKNEFIFNTATDYCIVDYNKSTGFSLVESGVAPSGTTGSLLCMGMNSAGSAVAFGFNASPYIQVNEYTYGVGLGTAYSSPTLPAGIVRRIAWSPDDSFISTAHSATPFTTSWDWDNTTGFGTKYVPTSPGGTTQANYGAAATTGAVIVGHYISPFIYAYPFTPGVGYGAAFSNPSVLPPNDTRVITFNNDYSAVIIGTIASTNNRTLIAYEWNDSTGFGTKYANIIPSVSGAVGQVTVMNGREPRRGYGL